MVDQQPGLSFASEWRSSQTKCCCKHFEFSWNRLFVDLICFSRISSAWGSFWSASSTSYPSSRDQEQEPERWQLLSFSWTWMYRLLGCLTSSGRLLHKQRILWSGVWAGFAGPMACLSCWLPAVENLLTSEQLWCWALAASSVCSLSWCSSYSWLPAYCSTSSAICSWRSLASSSYLLQKVGSDMMGQLCLFSGWPSDRLSWLCSELILPLLFWAVTSSSWWILLPGYYCSTTSVSDAAGLRLTIWSCCPDIGLPLQDMPVMLNHLLQVLCFSRWLASVSVWVASAPSWSTGCSS